MNLILNAEWPLTPADKQFLDGYVKSRLADCALEVRMAYPNVPLDPIEDFLGTLIVKLYKTVTPWGNAGNYQSVNNQWGFYSTAPECALHIVWPLQFEQGHTILEYEGRAFWAHMASGKGVFGHPVDVEGCPFIDVLQYHLRRVYGTDPTKPPDVRLRHVSNLDVDL